MSDLISRSALLKEIRERAGMWKRTAEVFCEVIEGQPTVEAVPVVYGEWKNMAEHNDHLHCKCSICGFTTENYQAIKNWGISSDDYLEYKWNFCPKCGTRMRKKV